MLSIVAKFNVNPNPATAVSLLRHQTAVWAPLLEMVGLYAFLIGLGYLLTGWIGFADMVVHPFWLPVLIMAVHYGLGWGLVSATAGAIVQVLVIQSGQGFVRPPVMTLDGAGQLFAAWFVSAAIIGSYRDRAQRRTDAAQTAKMQAEADRDILSAFCKMLTRENADLRAALARGDRSGPADEPLIAPVAVTREVL